MLGRRLLFEALFIGFAGFMSAGSAASALDLELSSPSDTRSLQRRLSDAKCYFGPIDGNVSPAVADALKQCPKMDPILSIETGMHRAPIWAVDADRTCRLLVTGSYDKTIRLWSLPEGQLLRTLRPPIGLGTEGQIYSVAMSRDGRWIAAGGWDARSRLTQTHSIYLFSAETGALIGRVGAFENTIVRLAFSHDNRFLAVGLYRGGLRVVDVTHAKEVASERYTEISMGIAFAPLGYLFSSSHDGYLRAYDTDFRLAKKVRAHSGQKPQGVAVDPTGRYLAVGFLDQRTVDVYRTSDLGYEFSADPGPGKGGDLRSVAWSAVGGKLLAGGSLAADSGQGKHLAFLWDQNGRGKRQSQQIANNNFLDIKSCGDGFAIGAAGDPLFALLDAAGKVRSSRSGSNADFRLTRDQFRVSGDGTQIALALEAKGKRSMLFDLGRGKLSHGGDRNAQGLLPPRTSGMNVRGWEDRAPNLDGKPLKLAPQEESRSLAIALDQKQFVLGTNYALWAFDSRGERLWAVSTPSSDAWAVNVSADGRLVVAAYGDGTIRWHRMSDGYPLLALFVNKDDLRWVAWTPSGYYMASPGGEDMIGWHVNRGWDQAADFFPASRFRERFSRPDIVQLVLATLDEGKAIEQANKTANVRSDLSSITSKLPPVVKILSPSEGGVVRGTEITVEYELRSPSGLPVDTVEVRIDGRPSRGIRRLDAALSGTRTERQTVSLPSRDVELGLLARSGSLTSEVATVRLKWSGGSPGGDTAGEGKPKFEKLYGVIVGVSAYSDPALQLKFAAKDARDFAAVLRAQKGGLYRDVELTVMTDAEATNSAIKDALDNLGRQVTSRDVGVVFLAGHGVQDNRNAYYFLAANSDRNRLLSTAVEGITLREQLRALSGKVLVFLDTCYAGQAMGPGTRGATDITMLVNELSSNENAVVTYASSTGRELSQEDTSWGNGVFTKALIEGLGSPGMKARADFTGKGVITTAALDLWVSDRVKELTRDSQHPVMIRPSTVPDFAMFAARN